MYSVVIPTMWRVRSFPQFLETLVKEPLVSEIIIINNDVKNTPSDLITHPNIKLLNQSTNIGVNAAWNLGVSASSEDTLCMLNDDIEFDFKIFNYLKDKISTDVGMIGIDIHTKTSELSLETVEEFMFGYACLFFINKNNYTPIPDSILIYYGDNWLFNTNKLKQKTNKKVLGGSFRGIISATSRYFTLQSPLDQANYNIEMDKFKQNLSMR